MVDDAAGLSVTAAKTKSKKRPKTCHECGHRKHPSQCPLSAVRYEYRVHSKRHHRQGGRVGRLASNSAVSKVAGPRRRYILAD